MGEVEIESTTECNENERQIYKEMSEVRIGGKKL